MKCAWRLSNLTRIPAVGVFAFLAACSVGSDRLDAKNVETFQKSLANMIADLPEADRRQLAQDIYIIYQSAAAKDVAPHELYIGDYELFLRSGSVSYLSGGGFADIVLQAGDELDKSTVSEIGKKANEARSNIYKKWTSEAEEIKSNRLAFIKKYQEAIRDFNADMSAVKGRIDAADRAKREAVTNLILQDHKIESKNLLDTLILNGRMDLRNTVQVFDTSFASPICGAKVLLRYQVGTNTNLVTREAVVSVDPLQPGEQTAVDFTLTTSWSGWSRKFSGVSSYSLSSFLDCSGGSISVDVEGGQRYLSDVQRKLNRCTSALRSAESEVARLDAVIDTLVPLSKTPVETAFDKPALDIWPDPAVSGRPVCN